MTEPCGVCFQLTLVLKAEDFSTPMKKFTTLCFDIICSKTLLIEYVDCAQLNNIYMRRKAEKAWSKYINTKHDL